MMLKLAFEPEHALEVEEIAGHSNACYTLTARLEEDEITGYSNSKKCSECCTVGLTDVKLHGAQTGFLRRANGFPVWKGVKLQGSQTSR